MKNIQPVILCACGCGQAVRIAKYPSQQPKYINLHQHRGNHNGNYKGGKQKYACPVCGKTFYEWDSQSHVTCGDDRCYREWQGLTTAARGNNRKKVNCDQCGGELYRPPSLIKTYNYCNRFCQGLHHGALFSGINNGNYKGGKWKYIQGQTRIRDSYKCAICGFDMVTDIHHITPKSKGGTDNFDNLITLCPNHHRMADWGIISVEHLRNTEWQPEHTTTNPQSANH